MALILNNVATRIFILNCGSLIQTNRRPYAIDISRDVRTHISCIVYSFLRYIVPDPIFPYSI